MSSGDSDLYKFGDFVLDRRQRVLLRAADGKPVPLTPKALETLRFLVENHGRLVEKNELLEAVWAGSFVEEGNLSANVRMLRRALGDDAQTPAYIQTVSRRGYRFIAEVRRVSAAAADSRNDSEAPGAAERTETRPPLIVPENQLEQPGETAAAELANDAHAVTTPAAPGGAVAPTTTPRGKFQFFGLVLLSICLPVGGIFLWQWQKASPGAAGAAPAPRHLWAGAAAAGGETLAPFRYKKVTGIGQATLSAISPDGKFIAYTNTTGGKQSLWLRQLATETNVQLLPPQDENFFGLKFSHGGEYLYFTRGQMNLYRIPTLGGAPLPVTKTAADGFSVSPDDGRVVFVRNVAADDRCYLVTADARDGSGEKIIAARPRATCFRRTAWAPDGKSVVATAGQTESGDANTELVEISLADGAENRFAAHRWYFVNSLAWLPDKSGLILAGRDEAPEHNQLWHVSYPGGEARKITHDSTNYANLTLTRDADRLLVVQVTLDSYLTLAAADAPTATRRLTPAFHGFSWLSDRKLVYSSPTNNDSLWLVNTDGSEHQQLTYNEANLGPVAVPGGKYVVYVLAGDDGYHVWRMNADGSNKIRLTGGAGELGPAISPDGRWVYYQMAGESFPSIWKVSIDGGEPVRVTRDHGARPSVSPDGKLLAYFRRDASDNNRLKIVVVPLAEGGGGEGGGGQTPKMFTPASENFSTLKIRWTPDGKAFVYPTETNEFVANLWLQSLEGDAAPRKLTDFNAERIFDFSWSPDGKQLGIVRGSWNHEVILISTAKQD